VDVRIAEGSALEHVDKLMPLLEAHWRELATRKDLMVLAPAWDKYRALEDAGLLVTLYMWDGDELIGYSCSFLSTHLHYSGLYYAHNDVLYLRPECRCAALGKQLIAATEKAVGDRGARMMTWHAKPNTALDKLLGGDFAYGVQDIMYTREL